MPNWTAHSRHLASSKARTSTLSMCADMVRIGSSSEYMWTT
uniref:Uncharacterized protein n=1 Tax=Arundo donax TaxID=35708 RepID=A0A0A8ZJI0_ARUDO